jgi:hypothetical protein
MQDLLAWEQRGGSVEFLIEPGCARCLLRARQMRRSDHTASVASATPAPARRSVDEFRDLKLGAWTTCDGGAVAFPHRFVSVST